MRESSEGRALVGTMFDLVASELRVSIFCVGRGLRLLSMGRVSGMLAITFGSSIFTFSDVLQPEASISVAKIGIAR